MPYLLKGAAPQNSGHLDSDEVKPSASPEPREGQAMGRGKKPLPEGLKVTFEAIVGRSGGRGIFALEDDADTVARQAKLQHMAERIAAYDRGYEGGRRRCPRCGQWQKYKG